MCTVIIIILTLVSSGLFALVSKGGRFTHSPAPRLGGLGDGWRWGECLGQRPLHSFLEPQPRIWVILSALRLWGSCPKTDLSWWPDVTKGWQERAWAVARGGRGHSWGGPAALFWDVHIQCPSGLVWEESVTYPTLQCIIYALPKSGSPIPYPFHLDNLTVPQPQGPCPKSLTCWDRSLLWPLLGPCASPLQHGSSNIKVKWLNRHRERTCGCQGGEGVGQGRIGSLGLADANYYI